MPKPAVIMAATEDIHNRSNFRKLNIPVFCNYCYLTEACQEYNMNIATAVPH
jgi:hypothetical protein